ncbi:MAG: signal peptidase I [Candidatus Cloacimonadota bacterium]|nr:MAG: signal peptidase I [Candidatus Cloacimonadota bacterium]
MKREARKKGTSKSEAVREKSKLREWVESVLWAFVIAMFIRTFFIQSYMIPTGSMEDTLLVGDFLLGNKMVYGIHIPFTRKSIFKFREPGQGEILIFISPYAKKYFVKRCIGVAGDTVEVIHKDVYVNGRKLFEEYVMHRDPREFPPLPSIDQDMYQRDWARGEFRFVGGFCRDNFGPIVVPEGHIFVMGDNRDNSDDSRFWGPLDTRVVYGKPLILFFSWEKTVPFFKIWQAIRWRRILNFVV